MAPRLGLQLQLPSRFSSLSRSQPQSRASIIKTSTSTTCPHSNPTSSLASLVHSLIRDRQISNAQSLILRMIRRSSVSRSEIVTSLIATADSSSNYAFDLLIRTYVQARKLREATQVFRLLKSENIRVSVNACNSLLSGLVRLGWFELVWEVYGEVVQLGLDLNSYSLNIMVNALCKDGRLHQIDGFLVDMEKKGILPDNVTYNTLVNAYCRNLQLDKGLELLALTKQNGLKPDLAAYNSLMNGFCKNKDIGRAEMLFDEIRELRLSPNTSTFNILMGFYCTIGDSDRAIKLYKEIFQYGLVPDMVSFSNLINFFAKRGDMKRTLIYYKEMKRVGLAPDIVIYTMIIRGFCKVGAVNKAIEMRHEMTMHGIAPDIVTYNTILNGFCRRRMLTDARHMFDEMVERGVSPDFCSFTTLIHGFCQVGRVDEALNLFDRMLQLFIKPDIVTYNTLIDGSCREGDLAKASNLWEHMSAHGISPNQITYGVLINSHCEKGQVKEALGFVDEMAQNGISPNIVIYNSLVKGYCQSGNTQKAKELLEKMRDENVMPDIITHNTIINSYIKEERHSEALDLLKKMERERVEPDIITYNLLISGFGERGRMEDVDRVLMKMVSKGIQPDKATYKILMEGYAGCGNLKESLKLHEEMLQRGFVPDDNEWTGLILVWTVNLVQSTEKKADLLSFRVASLPQPFMHPSLCCLSLCAHALASVANFCTDPALQKKSQNGSLALRDRMLANQHIYAKGCSEQLIRHCLPIGETGDRGPLLGVAENFLEFLNKAPDSSLDLNKAAEALKIVPTTSALWTTRRPGERLLEGKFLDFSIESKEYVLLQIYAFCEISHGRLLTQDRLLKRQIQVEPRCFFCLQRTYETANHLLLDCPVSKQLWNRLQSSLNFTTLPTAGSSCLQALLHVFKLLKRNTLMATIVATTFWAIWIERNNRIFRKESQPLESRND
ncbi:hypothetical protein LUZ63_019828 [Rhynchospora breviuscula]|uniref:Reverse transcriptase zinc-binding domain-containing protein n=1 Tax=Rhynchospora breviuscula TaxID=2022672 RepID=A0A9Q0HJV4_9POAL|nr:hypothetical protein LUZ63_019828 [Rhynchospora breviuscula]